MRKPTKPLNFEFVCPFCGYRAKDMEELKRHILEKHTLKMDEKTLKRVKFY